jgi:hypothetical protein
MRAPSGKEKKLLERVEAVANAEMTREEVWHATPLRDRRRALSIAGFDVERAAMPLATFSDAERLKIGFAVSVHVTRMEAIANFCMQMHGSYLTGDLFFASLPH